MATTKRKTAPRTTKTKAAPLDKIAVEAKRLLGWDPRITRYVTDQHDLDKIMSDKEHFTIQHPDQTKQGTILGFEVREVGALGDEKSRTNTRIVKVTPAKFEVPTTG